jgi:hypothetical protein
VQVATPTVVLPERRGRRRPAAWLVYRAVPGLDRGKRAGLELGASPRFCRARQDGQTLTREAVGIVAGFDMKYWTRYRRFG